MTTATTTAPARFTLRLPGAEIDVYGSPIEAQRLAYSYLESFGEEDAEYVLVDNRDGSTRRFAYVESYVREVDLPDSA